MKFVAVLVLAVPVVRAQVIDPCDGLSGENCVQEENCTFNAIYNTCFSTVGKGSVARQGDNNTAQGEFCTAGGGKKNLAGEPDDSYSVVGGGHDHRCRGDKNTIAGGKANAVSGLGVIKFNTISGGQHNFIATSKYSVITGGGGEGGSPSFSYIGHEIVGADTVTISGGTKHIVNGSGGTVTGGFSNGNPNGFDADSKKNSVITGGTLNDARGKSSVVVGGAKNSASGDYSIALGESAKAETDNSMAVNLMGADMLVTEQKGLFLMDANSYRFQIGNGKEKNGALQFTKMTYDNIDNLASALAE